MTRPLIEDRYAVKNRLMDDHNTENPTALRQKSVGGTEPTSTQGEIVSSQGFDQP